MLLLSGDVETNPGPDASVYPCGFCDQPVTWNCKGIACDGCNVWFHLSCADMASCDYDALGRSSVVWPCPRCDSMNCDSFTFRSFEIDSFNYFAPLQSLSSTDSVSSSNPFTPQKASTPNTSFIPSPTCNPRNTNSESSSRARSCSSSVFDLPPKSNLRIMTVNCQSVTQKTQELATVLQYAKPDIVCGTESWLRGIKPGKTPETNHIKSSEIFPDYVTTYRNDRDTLGGGVFILVHKSLISEERPELVTSCEIGWAKIKLKDRRDLYVGVFYMPKRKQRDLSELQKSLNLLSQDGKNQRDIILAGDLNCPNINWTTHTANSSGGDNEIQQALIDITSSALLSQVHHTPTRNQNILDLVFASNRSLVKSSVSIHGICDHHIVITDFDTKPKVSPQKPRRCYNMGKANWEQMKSDFDITAQEIRDEHKKGADADTLWKMFKARLQTSMEANIPTFMLKKRQSLPWITPTIKKMLKKTTPV